MSKTLLRGLKLIELVGLDGPLTVTELARRSGMDVSAVSRTVAACEPDGWLSRVDGRVAVGPRCALLGQLSPATDAIRRAEPLVRAIAGVTGVSTSAAALVGREVMALAAVAAGSTADALTAGVPTRTPVYLMADGRAIAAQLSDSELSSSLPPEPYPSVSELVEWDNVGPAVPKFVGGRPPAPGAGQVGPTRRTELDMVLTDIRSSGFSYDTGQIHPGIHCIARPWPGAGLPSAFACIGGRDEVLSRRALIEACLRAATEPGATVGDIARAAAGVEAA